MKLDMILKAATKTFAEVKLGGRKSDAKLAELDRGVLTVGLLLSALDGTILPVEFAELQNLAKRFRGGSEKNARKLLDAALPSAGHLMAMAQVGVYTEPERLAAFLAAAQRALPRGFADGSIVDLRRAFALWTVIGVADGEFSHLEKEAVTSLEREYAFMLAKKSLKNVSKKVFRLFEREFLSKAEKIARDLARPASQERALLALHDLIVSVPNVDSRDVAAIQSLGGVGTKSAMATVLG